eukprot:m.95126 g.95126  ORF g.95126 m.95126 type:complete len:135 (+) comp13042_c3_seq1:320-724(+)
MLNPVTLKDTLKLALDDGVMAVRILMVDGTVLSSVGESSDALVAATAVTANTWNLYSQVQQDGGMGALESLVIERERCRIVVAGVPGVSNCMVSIVTENSVPLGLSKRKVQSLCNHLQASLAKVDFSPASAVRA